MKLQRTPGIITKEELKAQIEEIEKEFIGRATKLFDSCNL